MCTVMEIYERKAREEGKLEMLEQLVKEGLISQELASAQEALIKQSFASMGEPSVDYQPE